jgi:hypothetical protein
MMPYPADFEAWYRLYPRREKKRDAFKAWQQTAEERPAAEELHEKTRIYAEFHQRDGTQRRFLALPATWLRGWRWADERELPQLRDEMSNYERWAADLKLVGD